MEMNVLSDSGTIPRGSERRDSAPWLYSNHTVPIATNRETMEAENRRYFGFPGELSEQCVLQVRFFQFFWGQVKENLARNVGQDQNYFEI